MINKLSNPLNRIIKIQFSLLLLQYQTPDQLLYHFYQSSSPIPPPLPFPLFTPSLPSSRPPTPLSLSSCYRANITHPSIPSWEIKRKEHCQNLSSSVDTWRHVTKWHVTRAWFSGQTNYQSKSQPPPSPPPFSALDGEVILFFLQGGLVTSGCTL